MTDGSTGHLSSDGPRREVPHWFRTANFGIFVHWGAYSVPAWAEPTGELGAVDPATWFAHNPYAEWYFNTIRIDGSPAQRHHRDVHAGRPYDDFLDGWTADAFDAGAMVDLFRRAGATYLVPVTKHHDGVPLWNAPGTGTRNTVHRGPRRDLVAEFAAAARAAGLRFGVYYSGGLDWHMSDFPPLVDEDFDGSRPVDAAYNEYAFTHVLDLVDRHAPDILWGDIDWPDAGKTAGPHSLETMFGTYYAPVPQGVVNDRWGRVHTGPGPGGPLRGTPLHGDFRTSEYQAALDSESADMWENCRGIGLSFGYNQVEGPEHCLDGPAVVRHLADVVSRGGNFLLNVGPDASGRIPPLQARCLEEVASWMSVHGAALRGTRPADVTTARPGSDPWVRWTRDDATLYGVVDAPPGSVVELSDGRRAVVPDSPVPGPAVVTLPL